MADEYASIARADEARELLAEGSLADTRLADEQHEPAITIIGHRLECVLKLLQLTYAADKGLLLRQAFPGQPLLAGLISSRCVRVQCHLRCRAL
jgi:hypothetical protein